jgi:hypothetical protein
MGLRCGIRKSVGIKCRRGDLNPHGTRYRQILSLLRMPISPLRRRLKTKLLTECYHLLKFGLL